MLIFVLKPVLYGRKDDKTLILMHGVCFFHVVLFIFALKSFAKIMKWEMLSKRIKLYCSKGWMYNLSVNILSVIIIQNRNCSSGTRYLIRRKTVFSVYDDCLEQQY